MDESSWQPPQIFRRQESLRKKKFCSISTRHRGILIGDMSVDLESLLLQPQIDNCR